MHEYYKTVFPEPEFEQINEQQNSTTMSSSAIANLMNFISSPFNKVDKSKVFKIKYDLNLIPQIGTHIVKNENGQNEYINEHISIMKLCTEGNEFDIFSTSTINDYIQFKWETFGKKFHFVGSTAHLMYVIVLILYNSSVYIQNVSKYRVELSHLTHEQELQYTMDIRAKVDPAILMEKYNIKFVFEREILVKYAILLAFGILYGTIYDLTQFMKIGFKEYMMDPWNYIDMIYIVTSISQVVLHIVLGPFHVFCRIAMLIVVSVAMVKSFFFLRIFDSFSPIVTMLS